MGSLKKFNGTTWEDSKLHKLGTSTDTLTTLPAVIYADGNNATVGISGNMEQNGTLTPDNPIMPEGTGERTGNLFDEIYPDIQTPEQAVRYCAQTGQVPPLIQKQVYGLVGKR